MGSERGQASVEWVAVVLLVAVALGGVLAFGPRVDGRSYGGHLTHAIVCAVRGGCADGNDQLRHTYGDDADLVRRFTPGLVYEPGTYTLPVDFRECRSHVCSDAPDDQDLDVHRSLRGGKRATVFTHVVRRNGETFVQYWLYYPDSTSTWMNSAGAIRKIFGDQHANPGFHHDDWESYQVRIGRDGKVSVRASSHKGYQWCKEKRCKDKWGDMTGWTRVSRGSHAGHIPAELPRERTTTPAGLHLVPIESLDTDRYIALDPKIVPPWKKKVYTDPLSNATD